MEDTQEHTLIDGLGGVNARACQVEFTALEQLLPRAASG